MVLATYVMTHGLSGLWLDLPLGLALLVSGFGLAKRVRATGSFSIAGIARDRFGSAFGAVLAVLVLSAELAWFALLTLAGSALLQGLTGLAHLPSLLSVAGGFSIYTALGGQRAVIRTDLVQLVLVMVFGLGIPAVFAVLRGMDPAPGMLAFPFGPGMGPGEVPGLVLMMGLPGLVGGDVYGRLLSARTQSDAQKAAMLAGAIKLLAAGCVAVIALGGEGGLDETLRQLLPLPLYQAAVIGILMAVMSSADSVLITGATVLHTDLAPRLMAPPRAVVGAFAAAGTCIALAAGDIVEIMKWSYTIFSAGAPLSLLAALLLKRPPGAAAAMLSMVLGGGAALLLKLAGDPRAFLMGLGISALVLLAGILFNRDGRDE